ncbi:hypothetical protein ICV35_26690 [Rhodococcus ruber]|uniref:hypothetical protein n=1 Tax=Rhodococcus ruber TaxID=1830 RepID=UPI0017867FBB|nr:hypothetical protein [Rhodococcus ruber]MBD8057228.1 hypothetical protein [Rhodococcus ruber]
MKLRARNIRPEVLTDPTAARPVLIRLCGLWLALTPTEAYALADQLHDAADKAQEK